MVIALVNTCCTTTTDSLRGYEKGSLADEFGKRTNSVPDDSLVLDVKFNYIDSLKHVNSVEIGIKDLWTKIFMYKNYKSKIYGPYRNGKCLYVFDTNNMFVYHTVFSSWIMKSDINTGKVIDSVNTEQFDFYTNKYTSTKLYFTKSLLQLKNEDNLIILNNSFEEIYNFKEVYSKDKNLKDYKEEISVDSFSLTLKDNGLLKIDIEYWYPEMIVFSPDSTKRVDSFIYKDSLNFLK